MSATVEDGVFAKSNVNYAPSRLVVTDFGFALPPDARVVGLEVTVLRMASLPAGDFIVGDDAISVWRQDDAGVSSRTGPAWPDAAAPQVYGGGMDTWGEVLTGRDVDDASFGISLSAIKLAGGGTVVYALVDSMTLSVYYCE